jgi:hypothetical protein
MCKEDEITLLSETTSLDEKLASSGFQGLKNKIESPILIKKSKITTNGITTPKNISKLLESYAKTTVVQKFKTDINDENDEKPIVASTTDTKESTQIVNKKVNQQNILNDIDNLNRPVGTKSSTSKALPNSKKNSLNNNSNSKPISDYFIKFEYKKINDNKFVNSN